MEISESLPMRLSLQKSLKTEDISKPADLFGDVWYSSDWSSLDPINIQEAFDYFFNENVSHYIQDASGNDIVNIISPQIKTEIDFLEANNIISPSTPGKIEWKGSDKEINYDAFFGQTTAGQTTDSGLYSFWTMDLSQDITDEVFYKGLSDGAHPNLNQEDIKNDIALLRLVLPLYDYNFSKFYFFNEIIPKSYEELKKINPNYDNNENIYNFQMFSQIQSIEFQYNFQKFYGSVSMINQPGFNQQVDWNSNPGLVTGKEYSFVLDDSSNQSFYVKKKNKMIEYEGELKDGQAIFSENFSQDKNINIGDDLMIGNTSLESVAYGFNGWNFIDDNLEKKDSVTFFANDYLTLNVNKNDFFNIIFNLFNDRNESVDIAANYLYINHFWNMDETKAFAIAINKFMPPIIDDSEGQNSFWSVINEKGQLNDQFKTTGFYQYPASKFEIIYLIAILILIIFLVVSFFFLYDVQTKKKHLFFKLKSLGFSDFKIIFSTSLQNVLLIFAGVFTGLFISIWINNITSDYLFMDTSLFISKNSLSWIQFLIALILFFLIVIFGILTSLLMLKRHYTINKHHSNAINYKITSFVKNTISFLPSPSRIKAAFAMKNFKKTLVIFLIFSLGTSIFIFALQMRYSLLNYVNDVTSLYQTDIRTGLMTKQYHPINNGGDSITNKIYNLFISNTDPSHPHDPEHVPGHKQLIYSDSQINDLKISSLDEKPSTNDQDWVMEVNLQNYADVRDYLQQNNYYDQLSHFYISGASITDFMTNNNNQNYNKICLENKNPNKYETNLCDFYKWSNAFGLKHPPNIFVNRIIMDDKDYDNNLSTLSFWIDESLRDTQNNPFFNSSYTAAVTGIDEKFYNNVINGIDIPATQEANFNEYILEDQNKVIRDEHGNIHIPVYFSDNFMDNQIKEQVIEGETDVPINGTDQEKLDFLQNTNHYQLQFKNSYVSSSEKKTYYFDLKGYYILDNLTNLHNNDILINKSLLESLMYNLPINDPDNKNVSTDNLFYSYSDDYIFSKNISILAGVPSGASADKTKIQNADYIANVDQGYILNKNAIFDNTVNIFAPEYFISQILLLAIIFIMLGIVIIFISQVLNENKNIIITMKILGYKISSVVNYIIGSYFVSIILAFIFGFLNSLLIFSLFSNIIYLDYGVNLSIPSNTMIWLFPCLFILVSVITVGCFGFLYIKKSPINNLPLDTN
ncbi:ABC transporter permease [Spiroplasma endosymbiont of Amphibalanus improvisus]|uniref:ABC transporter permease n=1 Tax=Spiroplasma endosymbiont of Amphibalanus improvisus TaxID=3066327 RepID=UPI00313F27A5